MQDDPADGCHLCGSQRRRLLTVERVVQCRDCGLVYRHPAPADGELESHYQDAYYADQAERADRIVAARLPVYRRFLSDASRRGLHGRLLDVGAGYGHFVRLARDAGWDAVGLDLSPRACARARDELGVDVQCAALADAELDPGSFDLVTLWNVLDQMREPRAELDRVRALLRPGGRVVVRVPNADFHRLAHGLYRLGRPLFDRFGIGDPSLFMTYNYSAATLRRLLVSAGLTAIDVRSSPLTLGDPYGSLGPAAVAVRVIKLAAATAGRLSALVSRDHLLGPSLLGEAQRSPAP